MNGHEDEDDQDLDLDLDWDYAIIPREKDGSENLVDRKNKQLYVRNNNG